MGKFDIIIGLGVVGVGGYLFIKHGWPWLQKEIEGLGESLGGGGAPEEEEAPSSRRRGGGGYPPPPPSSGGYYPYPPRGPVINVEDRFPDYVIEDRYPDFYPPPVVLPAPRRPERRFTPPAIDLDYPGCPPGWRWSVSGEKCKRIDCDSDEYWDGRGCRKLDDDVDDMESCPPGYRWSVSGHRCKKVECDSDEYYDGLGCHKIDCPSGYEWKDGTCRKRHESSSERRRRRREAEEISERLKRGETLGSPETDRLADIIEKAELSFIEVDYA